MKSPAMMKSTVVSWTLGRSERLGWRNPKGTAMEVCSSVSSLECEPYKVIKSTRRKETN